MAFFRSFDYMGWKKSKKKKKPPLDPSTCCLCCLEYSSLHSLGTWVFFSCFESQLKYPLFREVFPDHVIQVKTLPSLLYTLSQSLNVSFRVIIAIYNAHILTQGCNTYNYKNHISCTLSPVISVNNSSHLSIAYYTVLTLTTIQWGVNYPILQKRNLKYREV